MAKFVFSPSNINAHLQCPLKAYGQRVGLIKWKETPAKNRGITIHAAMEKAIKTRTLPTNELPVDTNTAYLNECLTKILQITDCHGCNLYTEHEMAINKQFKPTGFWDDDAFLRCKSDVLIVKPNSFAIIGDWKTGKVYEESVTQMRTTSLLVYSLYKVTDIHYKLFYIDSAYTRDGICNYQCGTDCVKDILSTMVEMQNLIKNNGPFLPKKNPFCSWCDFHNTSYCQV